jgi:cytidylate kinase
MSEPLSFEKCKSFIDCQLNAVKEGSPEPLMARPTLTISRQVGCGGRTIADKVAGMLDDWEKTPPCPWTVFDRDLVERVLSDHNLPARIAQFMRQEVTSGINAGVREILGVQPSQWTLVHYTTDTLLRLARMGGVILIGRGGSVVTRTLKNCLHVRLVGSLEKRVRHASVFYHLDDSHACQFVESEDRQRRLYLKRYFAEDIDNPLLYHMVINTDLTGFDGAAALIAYAMEKRAAWLQQAGAPLSKTAES